MPMPGDLLDLTPVKEFMETNETGESHMDKDLKSENPSKYVPDIQSIYARLDLYKKVRRFGHNNF